MPSTYFIADDSEDDPTLWRGGPLDEAPVPITSRYRLHEDPGVWDVLVVAYGGPQRITADEMESLAFDTPGAEMERRGSMAYLSVDGIDYQAPLAEVPS